MAGFHLGCMSDALGPPFRSSIVRRFSVWSVCYFTAGEQSHEGGRMSRNRASPLDAGRQFEGACSRDTGSCRPGPLATYRRSLYRWSCIKTNSGKDRMEKVIGIGGIFFKAREPERLSAWYLEHLGISASDGHADFLWLDPDHPDEAGRTVWAIFPANSDYFGPTQPTFMIDYRVSNLDRMLEQLRRGGVVVDNVEDYDYGRFAWITDPEGNRIELWEPRTK